MTLSSRRRTARHHSCAMILSGYLSSHRAPDEDPLDRSERPTWPSPQMALKHHHVVGFAHDQIDITQLDQVLAAVQYHRPRLAINAAAFNDVDGTESRCDEDF